MIGLEKLKESSDDELLLQKSIELGFNPIGKLCKMEGKGFSKKTIRLKPLQESNIISLQINLEAIQNLDGIQNLEAIPKFRNLKINRIGF